MSIINNRTCIKKVITKRCYKAAYPINKKAVRDFLLKVGNANDQTIDPALDSLLSADIVPMNESDVLESFKEFISNGQNRAEVEALDIIFRQDFKNRPITEAMIHDLFDKLREFNASLTQQNIFIAYHSLTKSKEAFKQLADIIQIIRYECQQISELTPFAEGVHARFKAWVFEKNRNTSESNRPFTEEQMQWLRLIRDHIAVNASISIDAIKMGQFHQLGGVVKFYRLFGNNCKALLNELNIALVA